MGQARRTDAEQQACAGGARLRLLIWVCLGLLLMAPPVAASDLRGVKKLDDPRSTGPMMRGNVTETVRQRLTLGFYLAKARVNTKPSCAALFTQLGADGPSLLAQVTFHGVTMEKVRGPCGPDIVAHTTVGGRDVKLCPSFGSLSVPAAAVIVIHEALHSAGLSEKPSDPQGLTKEQINTLVKVSCSL